MSKYSKLELIRSKGAKRIMHGPSFEKLAQEVVDRPESPEVKKDVEQFVLKFRPKKNDQWWSFLFFINVYKKICIL